MDGPTIQEASQRALDARGDAGSRSSTRSRDLDVGVPLVGDDLLQPRVPHGPRALRRQLADSGVGGAILPDLPLEEAGPWCAAADDAGVETVLLAAPTRPRRAAAARSASGRGASSTRVGLLGVTGERVRAGRVGDRHGEAAEGRHRPARCSSGVGVSTAEQAVEACHRGRRRRRRLGARAAVLDGGGPTSGRVRRRAACRDRPRLRRLTVGADGTASCARRRASPSGSTRTTSAGSPSARSAPCRWSCGASTTPTRPTT